MNNGYNNFGNGYDNFNNPVNSANMNPGFGMDPNLMTPSFQAPYRPQFTGNSGYSPYGSPSFGRAAMNAFGPSRDPYFGNPIDNAQASVHSMTTKPMDAAMWGMQNIALPYAGYSGMARLLGPSTSSLWQMPGALWRGQGVAAGIGRGMGMGVANSMGMGGRMAGALGGMGGIIGGAYIPYKAAELAIEAGNAAYIDPYVSNRRNSDILQRNFSNTALGGGGYGNVVSGKGMSYRQSANMGISISHGGLNDSLFNREDYSNITDMSAKAGLFDNRQGGQITQRVKDIAEQIKLIMAISKDPSIKGAIEELGKLSMGGASLNGGSTSTAASAYRNIGSFAAQAGTSIQKLMSGVGAQGQYMYQANGLTPYLGQLAAANSYAGFAAAKRSGLLSEEMLSRMGGIEGGTQSSLGGQLQASGSSYSRMKSFNEHFGADKGGGSLTSSVAAFASNVSSNPLSARGAMDLYEGEMRSSDLARNGSLGTQKQAIEILRSLGVQPDDGDKYSPEQLMVALTSRTMGLSKEQARAYIAQRATEQDSSSHGQRVQGAMGATKELIEQHVSNAGLGGGIADTFVRRSGRVIRGYGGATAENLVDPIAKKVGELGDFGAWAVNAWGFGRTLTDSTRATDIDDVFSNALDKNKKINVIDTTKTASYLSKGFNAQAAEYKADLWANAGLVDNNRFTHSDSIKFMEGVNKLALEGNKRAQAYINAKTPEERRNAMDALMANDADALSRTSDKLDMSKGREGMNKEAELSNRDAQEAFMSSALSNGGLIQKDAKVNSKLSDLVSSAKVSAGGNGNDITGATDLQTIGAAVSISSMQGGSISDQKLYEKIMENKDNKYSSIIAAAGGKDAGFSKTMKAVARITGKAAQEGTLSFGKNVFDTGVTAEQLSGMDDDAKTKLLKTVAEKNGGLLLDTKLKGTSGEDISGKDLLTHMANVQGGSTRLSKLTESFNNNDISFRKYLEKSKDIDKDAKEDSSSIFAMAVDKFATTVDKQAGGGNRPPVKAGPPGSVNNMNILGR